MNRERLLKLADFLDKLPEEVFDLSILTEVSDPVSYGGRVNLKSMLEETIKNEFKPCGAVACAIGWMPACFPGELVWDCRSDVMLKDQSAWNFLAMQKFLGIELRDCDELFSIFGYTELNPSPQDVAAKIRGFVNEQNSL